MKLKSVVWMVEIKNGQETETVKRKLNILLENSNFEQRMALKEKEIIAVKTHFGEKNTTGYIKPNIIKVIVDKIKAKKACPFLAETSAHYQGSRKNAVDHLQVAYQHGFTFSNVGAPIIIVDGIRGESSALIEVNKKHFQKVKIASGILQAEGLVGLAHFTGHIIAGFGATLKNIAMGLSSRSGKVLQHLNVKPYVMDKECCFCQKCIQLCPVQAIRSEKNKAFINQNLCIGCGECIIFCPERAISFNWQEGVKAFGEKMAEYAFGVLKNFKKTFFINFAYYITKECDCMACENPTVVADIGILASADPVALDKATNDLVLERAGKDIWKELHPESDWERLLEYAHEIGLGRLDYTIKTVGIKLKAKGKSLSSV